MLEGWKRLTASSKNAAMDKAMIKAVVIQALTLWAMTHGWAPEKMNGVIESAGLLLTAVGVLGEAWSAFLTMAEDFARKWGVTTPPPGEFVDLPPPKVAAEFAGGPPLARGA